MTPEEARIILKFHRPDRPRNTERRQLQQAIDVILGEETTEGDCISREALKEEHSRECIHNCYYCKHYKWNTKTACGYCDVIDNAQPVGLRIEYGTDGQPYKLSMTNGKEYERQKGKWLKSGKGKTTFFCSECGREIDTKPFTRPDNFPFCHCGADMRGGAE